jgi:hypothetical protein
MRQVLFLLFSVMLVRCNVKDVTPPELTANEISMLLDKMTGIMLHDVTNPPLASRFFSYACLSGYEIVSQNNSRFPRLYGILNGYPDLKRPDSISGYSAALSALLAMSETAKKMQPSGKLLEDYQSALIDSLKKEGYSDKVIANSHKYAKWVSSQILAYARADRYNRISNFPRYTPVQKEGYWYPTPPAYFAAIEPFFNTVRPFLLDTCNQFKPIPPVAFSKEKGSPFLVMLQQNYNMTLDDEKRAIAAFWDCNPFAVQDNGHLLVGLKKISPGAHWMGIAAIACKKDKKSFDESLQVFTMLSVGLTDAFICCWDEKFRSNRIRPETAIRKYIDPFWQPYLQTPPFPEYLSGHSTVSACASVILTHFFGENFEYVDDVEVPYGLPPRKFKSFQHAAEEAAISRFYGGIHFMDAIDEGLVAGKQVGQWVISKSRPASDPTAAR